MARSFKHSLYHGNLTASSDKAYKVQQHKAARRAANMAIAAGDEAPHEKAFGNVYGSPKDGKHYNPDMEVWK